MMLHLYHVFYPDSATRLTWRLFWKKCLEPGGVIALSFNTFTLPSTAVCSALENAGFTLPENDLFYGLKHEVEQAVTRDVIFAFNTQEESVK